MNTANMGIFILANILEILQEQKIFLKVVAST